jgi:recombination protein RecT
MRLAYAVAHLVDGGTHVEVMTRSQIHAIRDRSQNVQNAKKWNKATPWDTDEEQMWIKTVLRRICKYLPKSVELVSALALDAAAERGTQNMDLVSVIEGDYEAVASLAHIDDEETAGENATPQSPDPAGDATPPQSSSAGPIPTSEDTTSPRPARRGRTLE